MGSPMLFFSNGQLHVAEPEAADATVESIERESAKEFRDVLFQMVLQRTGDAIETLARLDDPAVGEKRAKSREQELRDTMVDIEVARNAAVMLRQLHDEGA